MAPISSKLTESPKKTAVHMNEGSGSGDIAAQHYIHHMAHQGHHGHHQHSHQHQGQHQHYNHVHPAAATTAASAVSGNGYNTKENTKTARHTKSVGSSGKSLEILDFHESWLEELELYKDQVYPRKNFTNQMLTSHNHLHTPQGCQLELKSNAVGASNNNVIFSGFNALVSAATASANAARVLTSPTKDSKISGRRKSGGNERNGNAPVAAGQKPVKGCDNGNTKTVRITSRSNNNSSTASPIPGQAVAGTGASDALSTPAATPKQKVNLTQLILKRPREENAADTKSFTPNNAKRSSSIQNQNNNPSHGTNIAPTPMPTDATRISGGGLAASPPPAKPPSPSVPTTTATPRSPPGKLVVKQNLANSFDDRHKNYMISNGYSKSAAVAYETSLYAASYLNPSNANNANSNNANSNNAALSGPSQLNGAHNTNGDHSNYSGVSLADRRAEESPQKDDPSLAIDDVNAYSESDDEDDYQGQPFYLDEDGVETKQSTSVREAFEELFLSPGTISSESADTATDLISDTSTAKYYRPPCILSPSLFPNVPPYLNFSSHAERGPDMPSTLHRVLKWKLSPVMPKIVKRVVLNSGFRIIKNTTDWMAVWEKHMKSNGFRTIRSHQKYNHMPGSFRIGRKDSMWRSIQQNMKKYGSKEFGFMQKSYIMPDDLENLRHVWPKNASKLTKWIVKPPASARGTGIRIINKWSQFPKDKPLVVQKYIERPLLVNENKFDMRIYVFLTSINPLRIYMYKDGLARFASVKYSSELTSLDDRCMHLTNYSINKYSENYAKNEDINACSGHKWTLQSLWSCLEDRGVNTKRLWATLRNLVIKAIVSGESGLNRMYRQNVNFRYNCFELFGFDVLLDENLIPWLLEINISPSLHSELPLDLHVKGPLIQAILNTALYQVPPKLTEQQQKDIIAELGLRINGPLCFDNRIFTTCLTSEEVRKHNFYTNRSIELREEYVDSILDNLLPDDVRCILISEDELARCKPLERIFPTSETFSYLKFIDNPRYYNRLLDAWESRYGQCREEGLVLLRRLCRNGYHLQVSDATQEKEPNVTLTDIDMLHVKKDEEPLPANATTTPLDGHIVDSAQTSKAGSPDSNQSQHRSSPTKIMNGESAINNDNLSSFRPIPIRQH